MTCIQPRISDKLSRTKWHPKWALRAFVIGLCLLLNACTSLSSLLFYPDTHYYRTPAQLGVESETIVLKSGLGATLTNWLLKPTGRPKASILFLHGNGENISTHIGSVAWLTRQGYEVFLLDYQGYGLSTGTSTLSTAMGDIGAAHAWLSQNRSTPLILFGQSMGGALAIAYLADSGASKSRDLRPFSGLITESAPASWPQIAREVMKKHWLTWLLPAPASLITSRYDAEDTIADVTEMPVLMLHSREDQVVPYHHLEQILQSSHQNVRSLQTQGPHISGLADEAIRQAFVTFINEVLD